MLLVINNGYAMMLDIINGPVVLLDIHNDHVMLIDNNNGSAMMFDINNDPEMLLNINQINFIADNVKYIILQQQIIHNSTMVSIHKNNQYISYLKSVKSNCPIV